MSGFAFVYQIVEHTFVSIGRQQRLNMYANTAFVKEISKLLSSVAEKKK